MDGISFSYYVSDVKKLLELLNVQSWKISVLGINKDANSFDGRWPSKNMFFSLEFYTNMTRINYFKNRCRTVELEKRYKISMSTEDIEVYVGVDVLFI